MVPCTYVFILFAVCVNPIFCRWFVRDGMLSATLDVLPLLQNGTLPLSQGTDRIFLEVGANSLKNVYHDELPLFPDAFLLSFEPLLHQYSTLIARYVTPGVKSELGRYYKRAIALPFAVGSETGPAELRIAGEQDGCASLLQEAGLRADAPPGCADPNATLEIRHVPVVSLAVVLGNWLKWEDGGGWPIDFLKIDAQGLDIDVLRSSEEYMHRILRVELEVPSDACGQLYVGSLHCSDIVKVMAELGYTAAYNRSCADFNGKCFEDDWEFLQEGVLPLHEGLLPWQEECWETIYARFREPCCTHWQDTLHGKLPTEITNPTHECWDLFHRPIRCCGKY